MSTTVHINKELHARLNDIAALEKRSMGQIVEEALSRYVDEQFWQGMRVDVEQLREDPVAWRNYHA